MYVYIESERTEGYALQTVGFYDPQGRWAAESDHSTVEAAAKRVAFLNGKDQSGFAADLDQVYEAFGIGTAARTLGVLLTNISNARRRFDCLSAIEREFFTYEVPDEDYPGETTDDCPLNWGASPEEYVEQFRAALDEKIRTSERIAIAADDAHQAARAGIHELFVHEDGCTGLPSDHPAQEGDKPLCRFISFCDGGDPDVGIPARTYWVLASHQSGTLLSELSRPVEAEA